MAWTTFSNLTSAQMSFLDNMFGYVSGFGFVPCTAAGTNTIALTPNANTPAIAAYGNYQGYTFVAAGNSTGSVTVNVNGVGALPLYVAGGGSQAGNGSISGNVLYMIVYNSALNSGGGGFVIVDATSTGGGTSDTNRLGSYKNLKIVNGATANSQAVITADQIVLETSAGTFFVATPSVTISSGSSGANGLDTGTLAASTWYSLWIIYNGTTTAGLMSASATSPTLPGGYTYYARAGWFVTDGSKNFMRVLQLGDSAQYVVTSSTNTANIPIAASGSAGSPTAPTWVAVGLSSYLPTTARRVQGILGLPTGTGQAIVAPNNAYGAYNSTSNPPVVAVSEGGVPAVIPFDMVLESTSIYWASGNSNYLLGIRGWTDNLGG